jgi:hypothetical protein
VLTHARDRGVDTLRAQVSERLRDQRRQNCRADCSSCAACAARAAPACATCSIACRKTPRSSSAASRACTALRAVQTPPAARHPEPALERAHPPEVKALQQALNSGWLHLGARQAFIGMCDKLRHALADAEVSTTEAREMLQGTFRQLNAEFGFSLSIALPPELGNFREELAAIERGYNRYFGLSETLRMASSAFKERFVGCSSRSCASCSRPPRATSSCGTSPRARRWRRSCATAGAPSASAANRWSASSRPQETSRSASAMSRPVRPDRGADRGRRAALRDARRDRAPRARHGQRVGARRLPIDSAAAM